MYLDRTDQRLKPRFVKAEPPSDADVAHVVQNISWRVIRTLRRLGYLEAEMDVPVATGSDPLRDTEPELARTMAASVTQRIAFGERAGQNVRRIGSGFGSEGERPELTGPRCASGNGFSLHANTAIPAHRRDQLERLIRYTARGAVSLERLAADANGDLMYTFNRPWSDGATGIKLSPLELLEKLAALVPLPRVHLVRYAGCLAPHSTLRDAIIPTPRQQGVDGEEKQTETPYWHWARLLGRVFALDMATCLPPLCGRREPCDLPFCRRGALRSIAAITQESVMTRILRHLTLASVPPPIAPARCRQELFAFAEAHVSMGPEATGAPRRCVSPLRACAMPFEIGPPAFPNQPSRGPRTGTLLRPQPHAACAACPDRATPRQSLLCAAAAGSRGVLGPPPAPRASSSRRRRRARGERWQRRGKMPFKLPIRPLALGLL